MKGGAAEIQQLEPVAMGAEGEEVSGREDAWVEERVGDSSVPWAEVAGGPMAQAKVAMRATAEAETVEYAAVQAARRAEDRSLCSRCREDNRCTMNYPRHRRTCHRR